MKHLSKGQFFGLTNKTIHLDGVTLTDTEYTHEKVDWHYHENPYFTFILQGNLIEGNKKEIFSCSAGDLLFHNWQEPHYNIKPEGYARGFHIEMEQAWANSVEFNLDRLQGNIHISNPNVKLFFYQIFKETKICDTVSALSIQTLLLQVLAGMQTEQELVVKHKPEWVNKIREILHDRFAEKLSLAELSYLLDIHPVHLSRDFSRYFEYGLGEYIRKLKIDKSLSLFANKSKSLIDITFECGFSDQSHFIRCFRQVMGISPFTYRKILLG